MARVRFGLANTLMVMALAGCGTGGADEADVGGDTSEPRTLGQQVRACEVLDVRGATGVLGPGTEHPGGDTEPLTCIYVNPGVAMLTMQLGPSSFYDQMTILQPHTPVQVGDRGRYNVQATGVAAVQFVAGDYSATLSVQPIGRSQADYLESLVSAAREVAGRLQ